MNTLKYNDYYSGSHRKNYNRSAKLLGFVHTLKPDSGMQESPGCVMLPCCYQQSRDRRGMVPCRQRGKNWNSKGKEGRKRGNEREEEADCRML